MAEEPKPAPGQAPKDLIGFLDFYLVKKAPFQLPDGVKLAIVTYGPWITLVLFVLALPPLLFLLGLGALASALVVPLGGGYYAGGFTLFTLLLIVELGLEIAALPGLFARTMAGWRLLFYARLVSIVSSLLMVLIVQAVLFGLLELYVLFQIRPLYHDGSQPAGPGASV